MRHSGAVAPPTARGEPLLPLFSLPSGQAKSSGVRRRHAGRREHLLEKTIERRKGPIAQAAQVESAPKSPIQVNLARAGARKFLFLSSASRHRSLCAFAPPATRRPFIVRHNCCLLRVHVHYSRRPSAPLAAVHSHMTTLLAATAAYACAAIGGWWSSYSAPLAAARRPRTCPT
jgi:hypothetical protein